jgi:N-carbamoylputrescine amidase
MALPIALVQMRCGDDPRENLDRALSRLEEAAASGARVACLQELFRRPYPCQSEDLARFDWAEPIPGPSTEALAKLASARGLAIVASLFERRTEGLYHNTAVVIDADGTLLGRYRKMHIPDDPLYYEKYYFTPGDLGFRSFETRAASVGVLVCWDQWFPEAARLTALAGAEIIFYPTAIGWLPDERETFGDTQHDAWETMMRSHAIANGIFVAAPNRTGHEGDLEFWGASFVCDPYGTVTARAEHAGDQILQADCDLDLIDVARTHWPFLRDRRIDAYGGLNQRMLDDAR